MKDLSDRSLTAAQYRSSANLAARMRLHTLYSTNPYGWQRWVFDHLLTLGPAARLLCAHVSIVAPDRASITVTLAGFLHGRMSIRSPRLPAGRPPRGSGRPAGS